jgi:hypothetical protein
MLKSKRGIAKTQLTPDIQKVIYIQHKNTTHTRHTKSYIHTTQKHNSHQTYKKLYIIQHHKNK